MLERKPKVVIDTNVLLDLLLVREGFKGASKVFELARKKRINIYIAEHSYTTAWYIAVQKLKITESKVMSSLKKIKTLGGVLSVTGKVMENALNDPTPDFEDAVILYAAKDCEADIVLSYDKKLLKSKLVPCATPEEFLQQIM